MLFVLIIVLTFTGLTLGVMAVYWLFARPASTMNARLDSLDPSLALLENSPVTVMAERVAEPINRIVPISALKQRSSKSNCFRPATVALTRRPRFAPFRSL